MTPDVDPSKYANKIPAIEIFQGDVLLFREERDGTVTTNEIQFQVEQESQTKQEEQAKQKSQIAPALEKQNKPEQVSPPVPVVASAAETNPTPKSVAVENTFTGNKADQVLRTAEYLINPLRQQEGMYDAVSVQGYQIRQSDQHITVSQGERLVLVARGGEVMSNQVTDQDWAALSQIQVPERFPEPVLETAQPQVPLPQAVSGAVDTNGAVPPQTQNGAVPSGTKIVEPANQTVEATDPQPAAFSVLERETQKLPEGYARELLQATIQDWKQQIGQWLFTKSQQGTSWLKNQQSALKNQRLASAVQQLFQRGHDRTGEHSYQVKGCTISHKGQNLYVLKDAAGELMKFKTSKFLGLGRRTEVISVSDRLTSEQRQGFPTAQADQTFSPQSSLDTEAVYAKKTRQVENTTRHFLRDFAFAKSWNKEGGQFKIEIGEGDLLRITDKQNGRGVVFQRQNGEVFSKLNGQDFEHFDRLAAKMQGLAPRQGQPATNNSKKVTAIEMD